MSEFLNLGAPELNRLEDEQPGPGIDLRRTRKRGREDVRVEVMQVDDSIKNEFGDLESAGAGISGIGLWSLS